MVRKGLPGQAGRTGKFYIVQQGGQLTCTGPGTFTKTERIAMRMAYSQGGRPTFYKWVSGRIVGSYTGGDPNRTMGDPESGVTGHPPLSGAA